MRFELLFLAHKIFFRKGDAVNMLCQDVKCTKLESQHGILSTALAKNHAKPAKGDTSHVTKMNIFRFSQLIMS